MSENFPAENPFRHADWRTYTPAKGLAGHQVEHIEQDRDGFLWFATTNSGVSRFDGEEFVTFTRRDGLCGNQVMHVLCDRRGRLWFATIDGGVCWYDGSTFHRFTESPLATGMAMFLFEDREGNIWCGGRELLCRFDGEQVHDLLPEYRRLCSGTMQYCYGITQDAEEDIWLGTESLVRLAGEHSATYSQEDGLSANPAGMAYAVACDAEGHVYVGGLNQVLRRTENSFQTILEDDLSLVRKIHCALDGRLWLATEKGGYCREGAVFHRIGVEEGLPHQMLTAVMQDREGLLWFASWGGGVSCCDPETVQRVALDEGIGNRKDGGETSIDFNRMARDLRGRLWLCGPAGLARWDGEQLEQLGEERMGGIANLVVDRDESLWLCGQRGLRRWNGERLENLSLPESSAGERVRSLALDTEGRVLIGHQNWANQELRIIRYDGHRFETLIGVDGGKTDHIFQIVATHDGAIWFALGEWGGPFGNEGKVGRCDTDGTITWFRAAGELPDSQIEDLIEDRQGRLWFATRGGLSCLEVRQKVGRQEIGGNFRHFTGAVSRKLGKVELALGGTLFLDEIGDMSLEAQVKLLRLLEERTFERVGGDRTFQSEARIVAATNRDLAQMIEAGRFREDLFYRLQVFPIRLPPLRERREDIELLALYFAQSMAAHLNKPIAGLAPDALASLRTYDWPGNVRELEHTVQRAVIVCRESLVGADDLIMPDRIKPDMADAPLIPPDEYERRYLLRALEQSAWLIKGPRGAAALLDIPESTLRSKMKRLGIRRN